MKIILQFPEGLKREALQHAERLEAAGHEVFLSAAACFGACDLCLEEARAVGAKKLVHFGHAEFCKVRVPGLKIEYVPYFAELDWKEVGAMLSKAATLLREARAKKVALVFPVQHLKNADRVKKHLEDAGFAVATGKGGAHVRHPGQVLGCDGSAALNGTAKDADIVGGKIPPDRHCARKACACR